MVNGMIIVGSIAVVFLIAFIAVIVIKKLKGDLKLTLDKTSFSTGEIITGKVSFKAKKEIKCNRFYVRLIGKKGQLARTEKGGTTTKWRTIYQDEVLLEGEKVFTSGFSQDFPFEMNAPSKDSMGGPNLENEFLNAAVKIAQVMKGPGKYKWTIQAILDAEGLDLETKEKKIYMNISGDNKIF